ncbi:LamG-like jellyroll fold domain-containing protein [Glutamicibacter sp.]|uniref:LamG-like jellyroll fold domain-containing protein n=1 Tax=Glutamicibacter sp. TaxID=1931995 RepID=UPI002B4A7F4B|nr:LamG-like jellyroll fold domain-containing protein [Glutamicibacter sp.]HJX79142.1 LamG-like jellyroll fold domain-containing protein [Glutamicibacter sp.]
MNKQNIAENELFKPDQFTPKSISANTEDTVLVQDPFFFTKLKPKTIHYKAPFEPDGKYLRLWMRFNHLGKTLKDEAFMFGGSGEVVNNIYIYGSPKLCEGPDDGVKGGRVVTQLNSDPDVLDYYSCSNPDEQNVGIMDISDFGLKGYSMYVDFMLEGAPVADNGQDPTIWFHVDDVNGDFGTCLRIGTTRELIVDTKVSGTHHCKAATTTPIQSNVWYRACVNYLLSGAVTSMRINNIPQTLVNSTNQSFPDSHENSVFVGVGQDLTGRFVGRIADIRWYRDLVFWTQHMDNIWNNHRSICATPITSFTVDGNWIDCGNDSSLWSQSLTKFSWSMWIFPTFTIGDMSRDILRHGGGGGARFRCDCEITTGDVRFYIRNNADTTDATARVAGLVQNKWQHLIGSYDNSLGSANVRVYLDGNIGATTANDTESKNLSAILTLGGSASSNDFLGYMKDFRWWTTRAKNTTEALNVYYNTGAYTFAPDYWLKMMEGSGNPVDTITRTKVGTLTGGADWTMGPSPRPTQFGSLAVAGYSRFNDTIDTGGYDSTGYDSTGFDTV